MRLYGGADGDPPLVSPQPILSGAWVNDKLKQGTIRVPEIHADSSTAATVTLHRTSFDGDTLLGEVLRQVLDAPGPHQTQITAPRDHWWVSDQGADVETWAVDVQLLVSETEGDPTVGMVNHPRAEHVAIKGDRALPIANSDHHMVQPHMSSHVNILPAAAPAGGSTLGAVPHPTPQRNADVPRRQHDEAAASQGSS